MLKPQMNMSRTMILWILVGVLILAGVITLIVAASGQKEDVVPVDAIYTNAALTFSAQQLTFQAELLSATPNPALSSPTATFTPFASPTLGTPPSPFATAALPVVGASTCDNSAYVSDVTIPDNTAINPGQSFTKTWKVSNTGTCTWAATYQLVFVSGEGMSGKSTPIGAAVAPGQTADVSVALVAPAKAGTLTGTWRLANTASQAFGQSLTVVIKVGTTTVTVSVTPTNTTTGGGGVSTSTSTPTATSTVPPTDTSTPTVTPTP